MSCSACTSRRRACNLLAAALLLLALIWPWLPNAAGRSAAPPAERVEWPRVIDGEELRPLAMSDVERRFAARFPGQIGRFAAAESIWILRRIERPTRTLHPAADCYRGLGYSIRDERLSRDESGLQRCFVAERDGRALTVCERIVDANGQTFTDASAWYWAAALGRSRGPWLATTRTR